jgi:AraC-like DNA-binding protein
MGNFVKSIEEIKRKLISLYIVLLSIEIFFYIYIFYFINGNKLFPLILLIFLVVIIYTYFLIRTANRIIHLFFIYASLLVSFIMLSLWEISLVCTFWVMPIPYGAYILLGKKQSIYYSVYIFILMISVSITGQFFNMSTFLVPKGIMVISDGFTWIFNLITFILLIYFNDRIQQIKEGYFKEKLSQDQQLTLLSPENDNKRKLLFEQIRRVVESDFKDPHLSVGKIASKLDSNHVYVSQAIKVSGFDNFNDFVNSVRIEHVKNLLAKGMLKTTTLFYIYSETGFVNHSTFYRAFKKIEGITPTEYVKQLNRKPQNTAVS